MIIYQSNNRYYTVTPLLTTRLKHCISNDWTGYRINEAKAMRDSLLDALNTARGHCVTCHTCGAVAYIKNICDMPKYWGFTYDHDGYWYACEFCKQDNKEDEE